MSKTRMMRVEPGTAQPCPHCGGDDVYLKDDGRGTLAAWVAVCRDCGATGGLDPLLCERPGGAIDRWNARVALAPDGAAERLHAYAADLARAAAALLTRLDDITTAAFATGGEREEREAVRLVLRRMAYGEEDSGQVSITLHRVEGNRDTDSFDPVTVASWRGANHILRRWARTAPVDTGYHKVDVWVTWPDAQTVKLRYDLTAGDLLTADLRGYMRALGFGRA